LFISSFVIAAIHMVNMGNSSVLISLFVLALLRLYCVEAQTYELYPKQYVARSVFLAGEWNTRIQQTKVPGKSWQATHLLKLTIPGRDPIYRLANLNQRALPERDQISVDFSPDLVQWNGEDVLISVPNGSGNKYNAQIKRVLNSIGYSSARDVVFNLPGNKIGLSHVAMKNANGHINSMEHLMGAYYHPATGKIMIKIGYLDRTLNAAGGGTNVVMKVWNGLRWKTKNFDLWGGHAMRQLNVGIPSWADQRLDVAFAGLAELELLDVTIAKQRHLRAIENFDQSTLRLPPTSLAEFARHAVFRLKMAERRIRPVFNEVKQRIFRL